MSREPLAPNCRSICKSLPASAGPTRSSKTIPGDFRLSKIAFDAVADRLAELPPDVFRMVHLFYTQTDYLNQTVEAYDRTLQQYRSVSPGAQHHGVLQYELDTTLEAFYRLLDKTLEIGRRTQDLVFPVGEAWRIRKQKLEYLTEEDVEKRVAAVLTQRARGLKALKRPDAGSPP